MFVSGFGFVSVDLDMDMDVDVDVDVGILSATDAALLDSMLIDCCGFELSVLMELAGLSVAEAILDAWPTTRTALCIAGPGNNGGDALVAAKHLKSFIEKVVVLVCVAEEKQTIQQQKLIKQCRSIDIEVIELMQEKHALPNFNTFDVVVDGIFGFSFKPERGIHAPFDTMIGEMKKYKTMCRSYP